MSPPADVGGVLLPELPGPARDAEILRAVLDGKTDPIEWREVQLADGRRHEVAADAVKVGGVRVTVTHPVAELIADALGGRLPTTRLSDLIWSQSDVRVPPLPGRVAGMSTTGRMIEHSKAVDVAIAGRQGLRATVGKDWATTNRLKATPDRAANYGWHNGQGRPIQPLGLAHNIAHTDYSQVTRLVRPFAHLPHELVSAEGPLLVHRHPATAPGRFVQSPNRKATKRSDVKWIVVHSTEGGEEFGAALAVARWFSNPAARASAHWVVDAFATVGCVLEDEIAWHAPGANREGIGVEIVGTAKQGAAAWADAYSDLAIRRAAEVVSAASRVWRVPLEYVDAAALRDGRPGVTTHADVSKAFGKSTHWDPGPEFPMGRLLALAGA